MTINAMYMYSKHAGKIKVQLHGNFSNDVQTLSKHHMHFFNVYITTV
jgi:hypothetical protein